MGTSKGYIAPSTPHWAQAKRSVSRYVGNPSTNERKTVASKYASAMNTQGFSSVKIAPIFANFISFASGSHVRGYRNLLHEIHREDILLMDPEEALHELTLHFSNNGSSIDDSIALDCISEALSILNIQNVEDLQNIDTNRLLKEMICQFAKHKFAQLFDEQIRSKCPNPEQANTRISEMQEYIYYTMELALSDEVMTSINPHNLSTESIVQDVLQRGFELMEQYYNGD